jgi:hypothetical protein
VIGSKLVWCQTKIVELLGLILDFFVAVVIFESFSFRVLGAQAIVALNGAADSYREPWCNSQFGVDDSIERGFLRCEIGQHQDVGVLR